MNEEYITATDLAKYLKVSPVTIYRWVSQDLLPYTLAVNGKRKRRMYKIKHVLTFMKIYEGRH